MAFGAPCRPGLYGVSGFYFHLVLLQQILEILIHLYTNYVKSDACVVAAVEKSLPSNGITRLNQVNFDIWGVTEQNNFSILADIISINTPSNCII